LTNFINLIVNYSLFCLLGLHMLYLLMNLIQVKIVCSLGEFLKWDNYLFLLLEK
jgi:hypothetical protein